MCISGCAASVAAGGCVKQYSCHKRGTNLWEGRFFTRSLAERPCGSVHGTSSRCRSIQPLRSKMIGSCFARKIGHGKKWDTCSPVRRQSRIRRYSIREPASLYKLRDHAVMRAQSSPPTSMVQRENQSTVLNDEAQPNRL